MIIVRFTSGLGNQMYQYNFYKLMKETYPEVPVYADLTWFYANNDHHGYELQKIFGHNENFGIEEAPYRVIFRVTGQVPNMSKNHGKAFEKFRRYPNRLLRPLLGAKKAPNILNRMETEVTYEQVMNLDTSKDWYLIGFWVEECYVLPRIEKLKEELTFDSDYSEKNAELVKAIREETSVSIHVRRGDYLTTYAGQFKTLGRDYYEQGAKLIEKESGGACDGSDSVSDSSVGASSVSAGSVGAGNQAAFKYFIFSDDSDFVKKEFHWLENKVIVDNNTGDDSFRDMQLMSLCKHNIIANSTFSAWAAMLNQNAGHITVYPSAYLSEEDTEEKSLEGWRRI